MNLVKQSQQLPFTVDIEALAALIARGGLGQRDPERLQKAYQNSQYRWFGWHEGRLMATAHAITDFSYSAYVSDIIVDPDYQGLGYGAQLMQDILDTLAPAGKIFIYAMPDKMDFYQRRGFQRLTTGMVYAEGEALSRLQNGGFVQEYAPVARFTPPR